MPRPTLLNWLVPLIGALALAAGAWALWALWLGALFFRGLVEPPAGRGEQPAYLSGQPEGSNA